MPDLTKGNLQSHLTRLETGRYIEVEKGFVGRIPRTVCRLTAEGRKAFKQHQKDLKKITARLG